MILGIVSFGIGCVCGFLYVVQKMWKRYQRYLKLLELQVPNSEDRRDELRKFMLDSRKLERID